MNKSIIKKFSGTTWDNKQFCTGELECQINITEPQKFPFNDSCESFYINKYEYINIDVLEKIFLVYELNNDFDKNNIDILIDLISDTSFSMYINNLTIFYINLALSCFFTNDITYIDTDELNYQIENGECNLENHIYKRLIEYIIRDNNKKFLIITVDIDKFIKSLFIKNMSYSSFEYNYMVTNKKLLDFVKSISISEYGYIIPKEYNLIKHIIIDIITIKSFTGIFNNNDNLSSFSPVYLQNISNKCKYFTIKISPDYKMIDKNFWSDAIYMLPNINSITFTQNSIEQKLTQNEMVVRRTKNCYIYIFTLKNDEYKQHYNECEITLNIDTPQIQILFNICLYMEDKFITDGNIGGIDSILLI